MGAWGTNIFDNDAALDWVTEFLERPTEDFLLETFAFETETITPGFFGKLLGKKPRTVQGMLEADEVLAAAEVVALLMGRPSAAADYPDEIKELPRFVISETTANHAAEALDQVLKEASPVGWKSAEDYDLWLAGVKDLRARITEK